MFKKIALFALAFSVVGLVGCETETAEVDDADVTVEPAAPVTDVEVVDDSTMMDEADAMMDDADAMMDDAGDAMAEETEEATDAMEAEADDMTDGE